MAKSNKQKPKSLTALAKSLDTRKLPLPARRGEGGRNERLPAALVRSPPAEVRRAIEARLVNKPAVLTARAVVVPKPAVAAPVARAPAPVQRPASPAPVQRAASPAPVRAPLPVARAAPAPAVGPSSLSRAGALASMQRSPSPAPARVPAATTAKPVTVPADARRQYPRAEIHVRAQLALADDPSRSFEATLPTVNLSVGGMFLESSFFLKIGTRLLVTLQLPQKGREVKVKAEVVRVESNVLGASGFALRFTEYLEGSQVTLATHFLSPVLREFLAQYAQEHRFQASAEYLAHTADVLAAWELKKAELGGDVWNLFSAQP